MSHAGFLERVFASWNGRAFRARGLNENGHTHTIKAILVWPMLMGQLLRWRRK